MKNNSCQKVARAYYKANRRQNQVMIMIITAVITAMVFISGVLYGKIKTEELKEIQSIGYDAAAFLEQGMENQYQQLKKLSYINTVGKVKTFGKWITGDNIFAECVVLDDTAYEKIYSPAFTNIHGQYPNAAGEVMLSTKTLEKLGIKTPQVGMTISVSIERDDWMRTGKDTIKGLFVLSGYYTEATQNTSMAFFSMELLQQQEVSIYPLKLAIQAKGISIGKRHLEKRLYEDVPVRNDIRQQFIGLETGEHRAVQAFVGSYAIGVTCILILLMSIYAMIYNVFQINVSRNIQQYGLLKTLGMTNAQIRKMFFWQIRRLLFCGVGIGIVICIPAITVVLPALNNQLNLAGTGKSEKIGLVCAIMLIICSLFVCLVTFWAAYKAVKKAIALSPIEASRYYDGNLNMGRKPLKSRGKSILRRLAWRNIIRFRKRFIVSLLSIVMGCEIVLIFTVISKGTDKINEINRNPDFEISTGQAYILNYPIDNKTLEVKEQNLMSDQLIDEIMKIDGVQQDSLKTIYGGYGWCSNSDKSMQPLLEQKRGTQFYTEAMLFQVVSDKYLSDLQSYVQRKHLNIDMKNLLNGTGALLLHKHSFSEKELLTLDNIVGQPLHFDKIESVAENNIGKWDQELLCSGYADIADEDFPELDMVTDAQNLNYFIISEKAFKNLRLTKQNFKINFDVEKGKEPEIKKAVNKIIQNENEKAGSYSIVERVASDKTEYRNLYYLTAKSDLLNEEKNYLKTNRMIMGMLGALLGAIGIINYANNVTASILSRKKEFSIMQSLGMTGKQLRTMVMWEGIFHVVCAFVIISVFGSASALFLEQAVHKHVSYFSKYYPIKETLLMMFCWLLICIAIPLISLRKSSVSGYSR